MTVMDPIIRPATESDRDAARSLEFEEVRRTRMSLSL